MCECVYMYLCTCMLYLYTHVPGEMWGAKLDNGSWNGLVGMLGSGEGDLGIANKYITSLYGRLEFEHYSAPYEADVRCGQIILLR